MPNPIIALPHETLRATAEPVSPEEIGSLEIQKIIKKMSDALRATDDGIGIAAPQINVSKRIFLASEEALAIDRGEMEDEESSRKKSPKKATWKYYVFINPEIINQSVRKNTSAEGCLSVPKKYGMVERADKIKVRALDEKGNIFERGASGLFARLIQHEVDHLNGILFVDKATKMIQPDKS